MKAPVPGYKFGACGKNPFIIFIPPAGEDRLWIRLFMRGPAMDEARGDPFLSRKLLAGDFPPAGPLAAPLQVHGTQIIRASKRGQSADRARGDGVFLDEQGVEGSLRFADCFPVIIASDFPAPWIALIHSGYKGVVENITGKVCEFLFSRGPADPSRAWAWIGPGISGDRYFRKKDEPWTGRGLAAFHSDNFKEKEEAVYFDLGSEIKMQLQNAGLEKEMICTIPLCTFGDYDVCYSYRRGDTESRMFLLACIK